MPSTGRPQASELTYDTRYILVELRKDKECLTVPNTVLTLKSSF